VKNIKSILPALMLIAPALYSANNMVSNLRAEVRPGQVFLFWDEQPSPAGTTFSVFMHNEPIDEHNFSGAQQIGHHIEPSSACDWWQDPASFDSGAAPDRTHGYVINGRELNPAGGLFVHTVLPDDPPEMFFAVLPAQSTGAVPGVNSLKIPVTAAVELPQPLLLSTNVPAQGSARGKSLTLTLHGRGGGTDVNRSANFIIFGDARQGWREGLARKFIVESTDDGILITPFDRTWIGRPLLFSSDKRDHVPAINTWWYGCNNLIYDADRVKDGITVNYTEEYLLYLVRWAQEYFETDPARTYLQGGSMGGSGAISVGFHHPDVFATIFSFVPVTSYTTRSAPDGRSNLWRLDGLCGFPCDETVMTHEGIPLMERMNSEKIALEFSGDLPFLVLYNGRRDGSIPWINNPPFYAAMNQGRRAFACYWNNQSHSMRQSGTVPADIENFYSSQPEITLQNSFPAFSNFSANRNPGNGDKNDGDIEGWINRGIYWSDVEETGDLWNICLSISGDFLPPVCTADMTLRRLTQFRISPFETVLVNDVFVQADMNGILTIPNIRLSSVESIRISVCRIKE